MRRKQNLQEGSTVMNEMSTLAALAPECNRARKDEELREDRGREWLATLPASASLAAALSRDFFFFRGDVLSGGCWHFLVPGGSGG